MSALARILITCSIVLLAACGGASTPARTTRPVGERCDAACWKSVLGFLEETCKCQTEACATAAGKRMIVWVTKQIIEPQGLTAHQQEVELMAEFQPYWAVEAACDERFVVPPRQKPFVDGRPADP